VCERARVTTIGMNDQRLFHCRIRKMSSRVTAVLCLLYLFGSYHSAHSQLLSVYSGIFKVRMHFYTLINVAQIGFIISIKVCTIVIVEVVVVVVVVVEVVVV